MSSVRKLVGTAWLLSAIWGLGCSGSKPATQTSGNTNPPATTGQSRPTSPESESPIASRTGSSPSPFEAGQAPPSTTTQTPNTSEPAAKTEAQALVEQIKELQNKRLQNPTSESELAAIVQHFAKILELSEKALAANPEPAERDLARESALRSAAMISQLDPTQREMLEKVDKLAADIATDTSDGPLATAAVLSKIYVHMNVERADAADDPSVNKRLFEMIKESAANLNKDPRISQQLAQLMYMLGESASAVGQTETAIEILKYTGELDAQGQIGQMAAGKLTLLEAIGKPPEIAGPTLDGSEIDISQFKGKVVLVDFWATWCGPCVLELPNVQAVYEKYHEEGFEVIAVSFDNTKDALVKFVEDKKLPWPQIYFDEEGKRGWQCPLGQRYGINSIPATFLVDRQGNLQRIGVRGESLEPAVVELLKAPAAPLAN